MKRFISIILIAISIFFNNVNAQILLETQLRNFPLDQFLNKPIDTLIAHLPPGFDTTFEISSTGSLNRGATLQINYPNYEFWVDVYITDAQHIIVNQDFTSGPPEVLWPLELLRKEKVGSVTIYTGAYEIINEADIY